MFISVVQHVAVSAALAVIVAAVCKAGRFRPAMCHALWLVVLVKLLTPPLALYPWAPGELLGARFQTAGPGSEVAPPVEPVSGPADESEAPRVLRLVGVALQAAGGVRALGGQRAGGGWIAYALLGLWVAGSVSMAGLQVARLLRLRRLLARGRPAPQWLEKQSQAVASSLGVQVPELRVVPGIWTAMTWNLGRPMLLVPEPLLDELDRDRWQGVIAHELAHLRRRDHWVGWVELMAGCAWWWNPVFWYARRRLHEQAEMACDAWVVWALPEQRRDYAEALVRAVEFASARPVPAPVLGMGSGPTVAFERRLVMILKERVPCRIPVAGIVMTVLIAALVLPGWAREASEAEPLAQSAPSDEPEAAPPPREGISELESTLNSPISIEFNDIHIAEIFEFIAESWDVNIVTDWRVMRPQKRHVPTDMIIADVPESPEPSPTASADYVTDGMVPFINLKDVAMREGLRALTRPLNLTFTVEPGAIWISSPAMLEADAARAKASAEALKGTAGASPKLDAKLAKRISIEFDDIHVSEIMEFLSDSYDVNLVLDSRAVAAPGRALDDVILGSPGYVSDGVVPNISLRDVTMANALALVLRPLNLTFKVEPGYVWISSHDLIGGGALDAAVTAEAPAGNK